jgi:hypothetical protein
MLSTRDAKTLELWGSRRRKSEPDSSPIQMHGPQNTFRGGEQHEGSNTSQSRQHRLTARSAVSAIPKLVEKAATQKRGGFSI